MMPCNGAVRVVIVVQLAGTRVGVRCKSYCLPGTPAKRIRRPPGTAVMVTWLSDGRSPRAAARHDHFHVGRIESAATIADRVAEAIEAEEVRLGRVDDERAGQGDG